MSKRGRPPTVHGNYQKWNGRKKECIRCKETKKIGMFPYAAGGTYQKSNICKQCKYGEENQGYFFGDTYVARSQRKPGDAPIFKPARVREINMDHIARHVESTETVEADFMDDENF